MIKQSKGITLIALIITIIILLILAGVTISTLTESGLFGKTKLAKEISEYTSAKEKIIMKLMEVTTNKEGACTVVDVANNIKNDENITIEKYYNEETALIKTGVTENLVNLKAIVVSVNEFSKYKFLIGQQCKITGVLAEEITDVTEIAKFKDLVLFENELFEGKVNNDQSNKEESTEPVEVSKVISYKIKDNNENTDKKFYTKLTDLTGNENDATLYDINTTDDEQGIRFNGTSSYAQLDLQQELTFPMTIEIDLKTSVKQTNSLVYLEPNSLTGFGMWEDRFVFTITTVSNTIQIPEDFFDGNLKHIVIIYNTLTDFELYINGVKLEKNDSEERWGQGIGSIPYLGRREQGNYFNGEIYEFRIYNRILSESEIQGTSNKDGLVLEYDVKNDENYEIVPNTIKDMTNNGNDATFYNAKFNDEKNGILFNGTSSYAQLDLRQELTFPMTIEIDLKTSVKQTNSLVYLEPNSLTGFGMWEDCFIFTMTTYSKTIQIPEDFFDGNLKHIVITYNTLTDFELYINGVKLEKNDSEERWGPLSGSIPYLGRRGIGSYFNGIIYEFNIYNKILSESEINAQYQYVIGNY